MVSDLLADVFLYFVCVNQIIFDQKMRNSPSFKSDSYSNSKLIGIYISEIIFVFLMIGKGWKIAAEIVLLNDLEFVCESAFKDEGFRIF